LSFPLPGSRKEKKKNGTREEGKKKQKKTKKKKKKEAALIGGRGRRFLYKRGRRSSGVASVRPFSERRKQATE